MNRKEIDDRIRAREDCVYRCFSAYSKVNGLPPTTRELIALTGINSTSLIVRYLDGLVRRGLLERVGAGGTARSIILARKREGVA